jgi:hypothetical protein
MAEQGGKKEQLVVLLVIKLFEKRVFRGEWGGKK